MTTTEETERLLRLAQLAGPSPFYAGSKAAEMSEEGIPLPPVREAPQNARESAREVAASRQDLEDAHERLNGVVAALHYDEVDLRDLATVVEDARDLIYRNL